MAVAAGVVLRFISSGDIFDVESLLKDALRDRDCVRYLPRKVRKNVKDFEDFLEQYPTLFFVENGKVVLYDDELPATRDRAVAYFEEILKDYEERPNYKNFKGHIGQADESVIDFMKDFYHGNEFKEFLLSYYDVFTVFDDDTVSLIENESVDYFVKVIEDYGDGKHYMNLRGHIGQAPDHVIDYINNEYPDETFLEFLEKNYDTFDVDLGEAVFLS